jgi:predicted glutamine amidotransferase
MSVSESNCHPFVYGPFSFMHNGSVARFHKLKRSLIARLSDEAFHSVVGSTDSAHLFGLFLDSWADSKQEDPLVRISEALQMTVETTVMLLRDHGITEESQINLAVADGKHVVACRYTTGDVKLAPSLYWHEGKRYVCRKGVVYMVDPVTDPDAPGTTKETVIIASEPLSDDYGWELVEPNSLVLNRRGSPRPPRAFAGLGLLRKRPPCTSRRRGEPILSYRGFRARGSRRSLHYR